MVQKTLRFQKMGEEPLGLCRAVGGTGTRSVSSSQFLTGLRQSTLLHLPSLSSLGLAKHPKSNNVCLSRVFKAHFTSMASCADENIQSSWRFREVTCLAQDDGDSHHLLSQVLPKWHLSAVFFTHLYRQVSYYSTLIF